MSAPPERTAVLVIRVWLEGEDDTTPKPLRARITSTLDISEQGAMDRTAAASEKEIVNAVRAWLRAFTAGR